MLCTKMGPSLINSISIRYQLSKCPWCSCPTAGIESKYSVLSFSIWMLPRCGWDTCKRETYVFQFMKAITKLACIPVYKFLFLVVRFWFFSLPATIFLLVVLAHLLQCIFVHFVHFCTKKISLGKFLHFRNSQSVLNPFLDGHGELLYRIILMWRCCHYWIF